MLKCGIVGCGVIAPTHIEGFQAIPEVKITCLCDLELEKAKKLGEKYGIENCCTDYRELLASDVDIVSVCTDHASHAQIVCDAIAAGKHVICEKSLGRTFDDLERMTAAAKAHPELITAGIFQHRYEYSNIALRKLLQENKFGKLLCVSLNFACYRSNDYYRSGSWRGTVAGEGGGILINQAIHHLDQLRYLFGDVKRLCALSANLTHQGVIEVEDTAVFAAEFESGLMLTVTATNSASEDWRSFLTITGSEAYLEYINEKPSYIGSRDPARKEEIAAALNPGKENKKVSGKSYYGAGHSGQLADFVRAVLEKRQPLETMTDAANSSALILTVYKSAASGKWEEVPRY